jgi:hypothetical protein
MASTAVRREVGLASQAGNVFSEVDKILSQSPSPCCSLISVDAEKIRQVPRLYDHFELENDLIL